MQHILYNSQWWNAGMGTSISILVSVLFPSLHLKIFATSLYRYYAHVHLISENTPTSVYKLSHTHIVEEEVP